MEEFFPIVCGHCEFLSSLRVGIIANVIPLLTLSPPTRISIQASRRGGSDFTRVLLIKPFGRVMTVLHQAPRQGGDISLACVRKGFFLVTCFLLLVTSVAPVSCVFFLALRCIVADCFSSVLSSCVSALLMLVVVFRRWPTGLECTHPTYRISCMYLVASGLAQESRVQTARQGEMEKKRKSEFVFGRICASYIID